MRTEGQELALEQLRAIARNSDGGVSVGTVADPDETGGPILVDVSVACEAITQLTDGVKLRARERFRVGVGADFPYVKPWVSSTHRRWAGTPHVHWGRQLCLYQASTEWDPQRGMYGFMDRLWLWLERAAAGELDPEDAPLHPPVTYGRSGKALVVARDNTPVISDLAWIGFATLDVRSDYRIDIVGWTSDWPDRAAALAVLLPQPFAWEYPTQVSDLLAALASQGVDADAFRRLLVLASHTRGGGEAMHMVVGTPMRRGADGTTRQHLAVWEIEPKMADGLRKALPRPDDPEDLAAIRDELRSAVLAWAEASALRWCWVAEARSEIVIRRDDRSPLPRVFDGRTVAIWGCGAIGGHVAEWIARAGAAKLTLYDNDIVTPGVLVRQPYTDDHVGSGKAYALADRLRAIRPDLDVDPKHVNVLDGPLSRADWHDGADIVIDATASTVVRVKLEAVRQQHGAHDATLVGLLFGHTAERGMAVVVPPGYSGGVEDALRQAKLKCTADGALSGFADEFWPREARTEHFQPEPGCSDVTFRGAGAEVAGLSGVLLHAVSEALVGGGDAASGHLHVLPQSEHRGRRSATLRFGPAVQLMDGVGPYSIRLSQAALAEIRGWVARNDRAIDPACETGGVLYGRRDEATRIVWIDGATGPPPDSVATPQRFDCGTEGVAEMSSERGVRGRGDLQYLGMWHTHPRMRSGASLTDIGGMLGLLASEPLREALMLIVGGRPGREELAGYVFNADAMQRDERIEIVVEPRPRTVQLVAPPVRDVGLALSGGGARAVAFHLGCLRALHDRGILRRVRVVSGVSGGALMTALWAYGADRFAEFDAVVTTLLRDGLQARIARRALLSRRMPEALVSSIVAGGVAAASAAAGRVAKRPGHAPLRRWSSRTDAFADVLQDVVGDTPLHAERRADGLDVVINACELRTGNAFRFGSVESGSWRLGRVVDNDVQLATAVAASAAYPLLLPALDRQWNFESRDGTVREQRVVLTDGGVFDNLGTSCLRPGRSADISYNVFGVDYVIACDAGRGQLGARVPFHMPSRLNRGFEASFRKLQDAGRSALHEHVAHEELRGFVMPYLGQQDANLPWRPRDLIRREQVMDYPTNFAAMKANDLELLAGRGEQLTRMLVERWCPDL